MSWWWLSFADPGLPEGEQFLGDPLPAEPPAEFVEHWCNRLLSREEIEVMPAVV